QAISKRSGSHVRRHTSFSTSSSNLELTATTLVTNPLQALLTRNMSKTCTSRIHMAPGVMVIRLPLKQQLQMLIIQLVI
ncbi:hypothetical protein M404DRAFT_999273, partial [Pisolithus tinctorius Marx 270]